MAICMPNCRAAKMISLIRHWTDVCHILTMRNPKRVSGGHVVFRWATRVVFYHHSSAPEKNSSSTRKNQFNSYFRENDYAWFRVKVWIILHTISRHLTSPCQISWTLLTNTEVTKTNNRRLANEPKSMVIRTFLEACRIELVGSQQCKREEIRRWRTLWFRRLTAELRWWGAGRRWWWEMALQKCTLSNRLSRITTVTSINCE